MTNPEENNNKPNEKPSLPSIPPTANVQEIIRKGNEIYDKLKAELEPTHNGKYVIIEIDSGEYFVGDTRDEATIKAKQKFPDKIMFIRRIGQVEKISRHSPCSHPNYAWLF